MQQAALLRWVPQDRPFPKLFLQALVGVVFPLSQLLSLASQSQG